MSRVLPSPRLALLAALVLALDGDSSLLAQAEPAEAAPAGEVPAADPPAQLDTGDTAWMLVASAFVMLMIPGLALFYGGMVRRKNILGTMMHSMAALAVVGVFWLAFGFSLAFGDPWISFGEGNSILGWNDKYVFLQGVAPGDLWGTTTIPVYVFMMFQGMFAILTPALISGAFAERVRFGPYCLFILLWVALVYCPLAHMVWGGGLLATLRIGDAVGALDFAGGTVVHISAGLAGLAAVLVLRKRLGYPEHPVHPSAMVLTLLGAALLWFGWFGFNAGSAGASGASAGGAFAVTQMGAASAALSWMLAEWVYRGKPTALGLASGVVAGLVAVTPAAGFVTPAGGMWIGLSAGVVCYVAVCLKPVLGYDDSLDVFGIHGVGGLLGSVLTGVFATSVVAEGKEGLLSGTALGFSQFLVQVVAALVAVVFAFGMSLLLVRLTDALLGFNTDERSEIDGLDRTEHGETGFDFGLVTDGPPAAAPEPRPAVAPPDGVKRFTLVVEGPDTDELHRAWSELWGPDGAAANSHFKAVYPHLTTFQGNRFRFRDGDPGAMSSELRQLFQKLLPRTSLNVRQEA